MKAVANNPTAEVKCYICSSGIRIQKILTPAEVVSQQKSTINGFQTSTAGGEDKQIISYGFQYF